MARPKKRPAEVYAKDEIAKMFDVLDAESETKTRRRGVEVSRYSASESAVMYRAILMLFYRSGLRIAEVLGSHDGESEGLHIRDLSFDTDGSTIHVRHGKGDKDRKVGMDQATEDALTEWLAVRAEYHGMEGRLFLTASGGPVLHHQVKRKLRLIAKKAGIQKRVHPHGFRHTHAVELLREGVNVVMIQRQLGHSSLSVTQSYVDHLEPEAVLDMGRKRKL